MSSNLNRIPSEIIEFFGNPGGHSLIVRGRAGAGKTTFALQAVESLAAVDRSFYMSTRVSDRSLFRQFPWLEERVQRTNGVTGSKSDDLSNGLAGRSMDPSNCRLEVVIGTEISEMDTLLAMIQEAQPQRSLVVMDSVDALAEMYGMGPAQLILAMQKDMVEGQGVNVIFVLESYDTPLDYLSDGVIKMDKMDFEGRRVRELDILKLRGCEIRQPQYLYTLKDGRFNCFPQESHRNGYDMRPWQTVEDSAGLLSMGVAPIDHLLYGGVERGAVVLIEIGADVPQSISRTLESSLIANFAMQGRGVMCVPQRRVSSSSLRQRLVQAVPESQFDAHVRVAERIDHMSDEFTSAQVMVLEGDDAHQDFTWQKMQYHLTDSHGPHLAMVGFDTLESIYGRDVIGDMVGFLASIMRQDAIFVGITGRSSGSAERMADLATVHIRLDRIGGTPIIFGQEPFTGANAVVMGKDGDGYRMELVPIL